MTINYINTGSSANAGNGDTLRLAFTKINANFNELVDQISTIELGSTSTLVAGTYTFSLTNTGTITLNDAPFVSGAGATGATGPTGAGFSNLTSTSSNSISTGTLTFTVNQTQGVESAFMGGQYVLAYAGTLGNVEGGVYGQIYSYSDQTLILASYEVLFGSGTTSSWYFELTGAKGIDAATGATGPAGPTNTATTATLGGIIVGHNLSVTAEGTLSAITSITSDVAPADPVEGDQWWDSNLGRGFVYYDGLWVEMSPNLGAVGPAGPTGPAVDLTTVTTDIIPSQDLTYDLGSTSNQWRSLYVGTNTIYIGGIALGVTDGNLTVDGSPVAGGGTASTSTLISGAYTVALSTTGNLIVPGIIIGAGNLELASSQGSVDVGRYLRVRDGDVGSHIHIDSPDNNTYDLIFGDDSKYVKVDHTGTVVIGNNNDTNTWTFALDGSLTIPGPIQTTGTLVVDTLKIGFGGGFMFYNTNTNEVTHNPYVPLGAIQGPMQTLTNVTTGTNTFDCETGHIFYVTAPQGDWTVNFINANNFYPDQVTALSIIIEQGNTAYVPTAVQVEGNSTTLIWLNNTPPTGNANRTEIVTYRIICTATNTYKVLATFQTY